VLRDKQTKSQTDTTEHNTTIAARVINRLSTSATRIKESTFIPYYKFIKHQVEIFKQRLYRLYSKTRPV